MIVWRLTPQLEDKAAALAWSKKNGKVALALGRIGDLREMAPESFEDIGNAIREKYATDKQHKSGLAGPSLMRFYSEVQEGDLMIVRAAPDEAVVMEVMGDYEYVGDEDGLTGEYFHQRKADLTELDAERTIERAKTNPAGRENPRWALVKLGEIETTAGLSR